MTAVIADKPVVATTSAKDAVSSKPQTPITREHLEKVLNEKDSKGKKSRVLTYRELTAVIFKHSDLVEPERLERFRVAHRRMTLSRKLRSDKLTRGNKLEIVKKFPQLLKNDPEKLLEFRYELELVTPDERQVRGGLGSESGIQNLTDDLLFRAIHERESLGLTFVDLLDMSEAQVNLVIAKSAELLKAKVLSEDELQLLKKYLEQLKELLEEAKSPLERQFETSPEAMTVRQLSLLLKEHRELADKIKPFMVDAKIREAKKKLANKDAKRHTNQAMPGLRHKR